MQGDEQLIAAVVRSKRILLQRLRNEVKGFNGLDEEEQLSILLNLRSNQFNRFQQRLTARLSYIREQYERALREMLEILAGSNDL
jgi:hypothetical protein